MGSEVFRFVTVHPPQEVASPQAAADVTIDLGLAPTPLMDALRAMRLTGARNSMIEAATAFVGSASFIGSPERIERPYRDYMAAVAQLSETGFWTGAGQAFTHIFNTTPGAFIMTDPFLAYYARSSDSIVAATIDSATPAEARGLLVRLARTLWLIRRLAANAQLTRSAHAGAPLVLPAGIFPLPEVSASLRAQRRAAAVTDRARTEQRRKQLTQLTSDLAARRRAVDELLNVFERTGAQPMTSSGGVASPLVRPSFGFALPDAAADGLSESTRTVLRSLGTTNERIDVTKSVILLERQSAELARRLATNARAGTQLVRLGNQLVPLEILDGGLSVFDNDAAVAGTPGPCPAAPAPVPDATVTVPKGHGDAKILGIADLMILEQELLRYELGEIAHIENVLRGETRSRTFKKSSTIEQTEVTEVETTEEKEQDLSSTERFELNTESQTVINDNASRDMGLTIHASVRAVRRRDGELQLVEQQLQAADDGRVGELRPRGHHQGGAPDPDPQADPAHRPYGGRGRGDQRARVRQQVRQQ